MVCGEGLHGFGLLAHPGGRAVEFHQQQGLLGQAEMVVGVDRAHSAGVHQFHASDRDAGLDEGDGAVHRVRHVGERAHRRGHRLGLRVQAQDDLGDDAQRALAAHHEAGEVVARAAFARLRAGANDAAIGQHHGERQHVFAHGAVTHGVGARGAGGGHATESGVGAGVDGEEQAGVAQFVVQLQPRDPGLHGDEHVGGGHVEDAVHAGEIEADAALHREQLAFERRSGAKGDDRHVLRGGQFHRVGHVLRTFAEHHGGRRRHVEGRFIAPMLLAHRLRGGKLRAEAAGQGVEQGGRRGAGENFRGEGDVHGMSSVSVSG